jgi:hypothetical protein
MDPYQGGAQHRPATGAFSRKKKDEDERRRQQAPEEASVELEIDPFLAEIDRIRVLDPSLTESGAHRALLAVKAYQRSPGDPPPPAADDPFDGVPDASPPQTVADKITTRGFVRRDLSPPPVAPATGSEAPAP